MVFCVYFVTKPLECDLLFRLDYLSCVLTIVSTVLIGRRKWQGWIVAGANSMIICVIAVRTSQTGFIPANLFCLALYAANIYQWRNGAAAKPKAAQPAAPVISSIQTAEESRTHQRMRRLPAAASMSTPVRRRTRPHSARTRSRAF